MSPKVLVFDIETSPVLAYVWNLFDQNIALNQIHDDWQVLSWSAKWLGDPPNKIMYMDRRKSNNDKAILKGIWNLLNEADIVVTQNGIRFDQKKLNARFVLNGLKPPSSYKHIDTLKLAKKHFAFTSNKLEYLTNKLCKKYKKLKHDKYSGFELWKQCLSGNLDAWKEMERYNKWDVLSLEELYYKLIAWDNNVSFNIYREDNKTLCNCGSNKFAKNGFFYSSVGRYQRYRCSGCGAEFRDNKNELSKEKKQSLKRSTK